MTSQQIQPKRAVVKQVLSGDSVILRALSGAPPPEKQLNFSGIVAPKLARRPGDGSVETSKDEPWAWEAREFLRKKLIGQEVLFTSEKPPNANREYGCIYLGKDIGSAENITESLVKEGLVSVRRESLRQGSELQSLAQLEDAAKAAGKGKWGTNNAEHVRDIKWSIDNMRSYVDKLGYKPVKAIVEHIRDGSTVRAFLLPDFYHITLMISGIRCPGFKLDANGKPNPNVKVPFAEEARYFVERHLLQCEVEIILESVNNTNFVGTILHPKGNIAEQLLKRGYAHCVDWSIVFMKSGVEVLRAAEKEAKAKRLGIWKEWQSNAPQINGKEKQYTAQVVEVVNGDALVLKLANGDQKKVFLSSIRPPKEAGRVADDDGKTAPRPKGFRPLYNIPYMFEAREYLRKKLIGKKVHVNVDYIQEAKDGYPEKTCATVTIGGKNVAEGLVLKGLASVVKYRHDDDQRSSCYDDLLSAEDKASKNGVGIHSKKDENAHRVNVTEIDAARAKLELSLFQRAQRVDAVVEFVASGTRLRLFIPRNNSLCTFLLGGINCPRASRQATNNQPAVEGEPYGDEALQFTKDRCLQREVSIQVDSHDKVGNFIGWLWADNVNLSVALVREGFASVHRTGEKSQYAHLLKEAEDSAKAQRLRIWKDYVEEEKEELSAKQQQQDEEKSNVERKVNYEEVVVTEITPEGTFFVQNIAKGPKAEALCAKLRQEFQANPPLPGAYNAKRGDLCAAKYTADDEWYRAKIEKIQGGGKATVLYIDYGNRETLATTRLASLPSGYAHEKPYATEYILPFVTLPKDDEFNAQALKYLREDTAVSKLYLNVEYKPQGSLPAASLHLDKNAGTDTDIVKNLILDGLLLVDFKKERRNHKLLSIYKEAQDVAKRNHTNIWEYGDITEDDAKEFGLGK